MANEVWSNSLGKLYTPLTLDLHVVFGHMTAHVAVDACDSDDNNLKGAQMKKAVSKLCSAVTTAPNKCSSCCILPLKWQRSSSLKLGCSGSHCFDACSGSHRFDTCSGSHRFDACSGSHRF